jgi:hypothetical protein
MSECTRRLQQRYSDYMSVLGKEMLFFSCKIQGRVTPFEQKWECIGENVTALRVQDIRALKWASPRVSTVVMKKRTPALEASSAQVPSDSHSTGDMLQSWVWPTDFKQMNTIFNKYFWNWCPSKPKCPGMWFQEEPRLQKTEKFRVRPWQLGSGCPPRPPCDHKAEPRRPWVQLSTLVPWQCGTKQRAMHTMSHMRDPKPAEGLPNPAALWLCPEFSSFP